MKRTSELDLAGKLEPNMETIKALLEIIEDLRDRISVYEALGSDPSTRLSFEQVKAELGIGGTDDTTP